MTPEEFRERRERLRLDRKQLSELLGVSVHACRKYETGPEKEGNKIRLNKIPAFVVRLFDYIEADLGKKKGNPDAAQEASQRQ